MELLGNNPSMQDLIEKLNEVVGSLNNSLPNTDSELAEVKKLVSFGSNVLAGRLNAKLWYFKTQELMKASTELCEGDSCFILNPGGNTGEGTFEYWYIYKTSDVGEILDSYIELANPDLVGVKIQELTFKALLSKFDSIKKFSFLDLVTTATETNPGKALDAIVGKLLADRIGNLEELSTVDKNSLVGAIKEVKTVVEDNYSENTKKINSKAERTELQTETSERKQEIAVERARINNLLKSTSDTVTSTCEVSDEYGGNASAEVSSDGINVQIKLTNFQFLKTWESSDGTEATASPEKILDLPNHSFAPFEERTVVYTDGTLTYYIENDSLYVTSSTDTISIFGDVTISYAIIDSLQSEVADIRVGADGKVYGTAGEAVRGQVSELKGDLSNLSGESKNIIKLQNRTTVVNGVSITTNALGTATMHGTATASGNYKIALCDTFTLKAGTYTAHMEKGNVDDAVGTWYIVSNGAKFKTIPELQPVTFTIDSDTDVTMGVNMPEGTTYNCEIKLQIESGSVSTEFVPSVTANDFFARKEIENIKANIVKKYSSKTWVCVGDSLTEENTATTKHYFDYISDKTGINVVNMGNGGSGYRKEYELNTAFYQRVANDLPAIGVDVVTIFGSGNDLNPIDDGTGRGWSAFLGSPTDNTEDTICGCINLTIDNVYAKLPTVPLGIILPTPWASSWNDTKNRLANADDTVTQYKKWYTYTEAIKTICQNRGIPYLDLFRESTLRPWDVNYRNLCYSKDAGQDGNPAGVHPDETGHSIIAPMINEFIDKLISTR